MFQLDLAAERMGFIGLRVMPPFEAAKQAGTFGKVALEQLLKVPETRRAPRSNYNRIQWEFQDASYATEEHGLEGPVDDRQAVAYRSYFDAEQATANIVRDNVLRAMEIRIAAKLFDTATYTGANLTLDIVQEWDDATNAVPVNDVDFAKTKVWTNTGLWPNAIVMSRNTFNLLRKCDQIIDRIAAQGAGDRIRAGDITAAQIAACFDLRYVFVAGSAKDSAKEGQTRSIASIWSDNMASVLRVAETDNIEEPCWGRCIHWSEDGSEIGGAIESYRDESARSDIIRVRMDTHEKVIYTELAFLLTDVLT
jgi:hypothetical protein